MLTPKFTPIKNSPGWSRAEVDGDFDSIEEFSKTLNLKRPANTYFVCGLLPDDGEYGLYRIETNDPLDIIKAFQVGSHAVLSYNEDARQKVFEQMAMVHAQNPIVPFFADAAGLKCTFERRISEDFAEFLDSAISEGVEIYAEEGYIGPVVMREKFLHLWWD